MTSINKKKLTAKDFNVAKSKWTKAVAKYELINLIENNKVHVNQRKNPKMFDVIISHEKYSFNIEKPLTKTFSNASFQTLHVNQKVKM